MKRYWNIYFMRQFVATVIATSSEECRKAMLDRGYLPADVDEMRFVDSSACGKVQHEQSK